MPAPVSMARWISTFLEAQAAELDAARNTLLAYGRDLLAFSEWLAARGEGFADASRDTIEAYLIACEAEGLAAATRARRLSSIRQLYRFAFDEGWRADNPAIRINGPGRGKRLPKVLDVAEVERLLTAARSHGRDRTRNTCLMELLYATGMRVSELVSLSASAVRGDPRMILVRGKGGKERLVPLAASAREAVTDWLLERDGAEDLAKRKGQPPSKFLFPSRGALGHMTRQRFFALVRELAVAAGLSPERVTPHVLRHAFATHLLAGGADLRSIQTMLGHADLATTEIYTHVVDDQLRQLVEDHHPLARPRAKTRPTNARDETSTDDT